MLRSLAVALLSTFVSLLFAGCVVRFTNSERGLSSSLRKIYLPSATDTSSRGGSASRLSYAVRMQLSLRTEISLVSLDEARLAIDLQVQNQSRTTATDRDCTSGKNDKQTLASESVACGSLGFGQAEVSAETENVTLVVLARAIDLNNGSVIFSEKFISSTVYPILSDDEAIRANYSRLRPYHALRYMENVDNGIESLGSTIAGQIVSKILNIDSSVIK